MCNSGDAILSARDPSPSWIQTTETRDYSVISHYSSVILSHLALVSVDPPEGTPSARRKKLELAVAVVVAVDSKLP